MLQFIVGSIAFKILYFKFLNYESNIEVFG